MQHNIISCSIIIRVLDERENLGQLLDILDRQDNQNFETIVVDNESTDGTADLARSRGAKVISLPRKEFSYPYASNLGASTAHGEILVFLSAHSFPLSTNWLSAGLKHFDDPRVAGVYSRVLPHEDATLAEKLSQVSYYWTKILGVRRVRKSGTGVLGSTNCAIRRSLWEKHPFDEAYGLGGEDEAWAKWALAQGYRIICEPKFVVRHSHGLNFSAMRKQFSYWQSLNKPAPFDRKKLNFRNEEHFKE